METSDLIFQNRMLKVQVDHLEQEIERLKNELMGHRRLLLAWLESHKELIEQSKFAVK